MCSPNMQQTYKRTTMRNCDLSKVANQLLWNYASACVFSGKFAAYFQNSCFDKHLWRTTSVNFYSICLPYFSIQIRVKFGLFSNIFLTSSMFSSERAVLRLPEFPFFVFRLVPCEHYSVTFCWIAFSQGGAWLNHCQNAAWASM